MKRIYLDYASLTPIDPRVLREMKRFSAGTYANPSSLYKEGVAAKKALEEARQSIGSNINAHADEIVFTSGGTEANCLAIEGVGRAARYAGVENPHMIFSAIEHSSVMEMSAMMGKHGVEVTILPVDASGLISLDELKKAIKPNTVLVSVMTVNNEVGTIQPVREIAKIVRNARKDSRGAYPLFHTDAAQALYEELNMESMAIDLLTLDGGKVYGPRGIGALYVRRGTPIEAIAYGGGQERGLRSGTENIPAIKGFAKALELVKKEKEKMRFTQVKWRDMFIQRLKAIRTDIVINGADAPTSPHILSVSIPGIDNEFLLFQLDAAGIACSTKSSCLRDADESYVLKAVGADSGTTLRFSFGRWTKKGDIVKTVKALASLL